MLVVAIVAILFVGPKELPGMLRAFGKGVKKVRGLAGDFQRQFDDALKEAELDGIKDTIKDVRNLDPTKAIKDKLNPLKADLDDAKKTIEENAPFDGDNLFDDSKAPEISAPVKVDVESALERQRKNDKEFAKTAPSSGKNAVPGFGGPAGDTDAAKADKGAGKTPAAKKSAARKPSAKKSSAKKPAAGNPAVKKPAARKPAVSKTVVKKPAARKPAVKSKASTSAAATQKSATKPANTRRAAVDKSTDGTKKPAAGVKPSVKPTAKPTAKPSAQTGTTTKKTAAKRKPAKKAET